MNREIKFSIPPGTEASHCRSCRATIYWVTTAAGKQMPVDSDGRSHWATCPTAAQHRQHLKKPKIHTRTLKQVDLFDGGL